MKTKQNGKGGLYFAVLLTLVFFFGCVNGGEHQNQAQERAAQGDDMSDEIWSIEDYTRELGTFEGLDAETEWQILLDYLKRYIVRGTPININEFYIWYYYGTYNGYVVVALEDPLRFFYAVVGGPDAIDGIELPWQWPWEPTVWNNGEFYKFRELYYSGLLTRDDLESTASWGVK